MASVLPETKQGKYQRTGVLWYNEEQAAEYVRMNQSIKGTPNKTAINFGKWVNKSLLPNSTLEPGYPWKVSVETARRWLHQLGIKIITPRKGIFIGGHKCEDVVEYRKTFLCRMVKIGFLHFTNAPLIVRRKHVWQILTLRHLSACLKQSYFSTMKAPYLQMKTRM